VGGPQLAGQTVLVIGGSSGIGLATARQAHDEGAKVILTGRDPERVQRAGLEVHGSIAAFDATDFERLDAFFDGLPTSIDHVLLTGPAPCDMPVAEFSVRKGRRELDTHLLLPLQVAHEVALVIRPGGTLIFTGCTDGRRTTAGRALIAAITAGLSAMAKSLAAELAPIRVNVIAPGYIDRPPSAIKPDDELYARREHLETRLPARRLTAPADVAALAIHLMTNTAITGATFDIDGGQQLIER
jgi:NAD(P)-dependent dehydrogenase (short-subunit alcohol dehydrogenase family)